MISKTETTTVLAKPNYRHALFKLAYGRMPTSEEDVQLHGLLPGDETPFALRQIVSLFNRSIYQTPIHVRCSASDIQKMRVEGFDLCIDRADFAVSMQIEHYKNYEPHLCQFFRDVINPGMRVVDIGANIGFFSMLAASLGADVISFEPNSENCRLILMSAMANGFMDRVTLRPLALSNYDGFTYFSTYIGSNGGIIPTAEQTLLSPNCTVVPCSRLDDLNIGNVDFIKADIEGAEYLALTGAEKTIRKSKPILTIEFSFDMARRVSGIDGVDLLRWIEGFGYRGQILGREGVPEPIGDLSTFRDRWGSNPTRIEDIAFIPI